MKFAKCRSQKQWRILSLNSGSMENVSTKARGQVILTVIGQWSKTEGPRENINMREHVIRHKA